MAVFTLDDTPLLTHTLNIGSTAILNIEPEPVAVQQILGVTKSSGLTLGGVTRPTIDFEFKGSGGGSKNFTRWYFRNDDSEANRNTIYNKIRDIISIELSAAT